MGMWSFIVGTVDFATQYGWRLAYAFAAMTALEIAFPAAGRGGWLDRARSLSFWMAYVALTAIGMTLFLRAWSILGWRPLFSLRFVGAPIIGLMLTDFFYYWFHRLQHRSAWLWRFHAVHHSIANMSAVNSPHHFTEELFRIPFVVVPVALLFQVDTWFPVAVMTVIGMHGYYIHSSTRLHFGRLGWIVNDARMHGLHHSLAPEHRDRNFASVTPIWDILFGTFAAPRPGEIVRTGLAEIAAPRGLRDYLFRPFR